MKHKWIWTVLILIVAVIAISCFQNERKPSEIKIGVLFPLTGDAASYGEKGQKAIDMAVEKINADGGINGKKIVAIYEDSRAEPKTGVAAAKKLIDIDHVPAIVGDIVSAVTLPAAPVAEEKKVILLSPTSSAPAITNSGEFIYRIWPSDLAEGKAVAEFARKRGYNRAAILHLNNDYGLAIASIFKKAFESQNNVVVLMEGYSQTANDYRSVLSKVENTNPDVVYIAGYYADTSKLLRQAHELGIKSQFLGTTAIEDDKFLELSGDAAENIIYPLATGFNPLSTSRKVTEFIDGFQKKYNYQPGWVEAQSYDAFMLIVAAVKNISGKIDGTKIKGYLDSMGEYDGVTGKIKFDKNGDVLKSVIFKTVRAGKFQYLVD